MSSGLGIISHYIWTTTVSSLNHLVIFCPGFAPLILLLISRPLSFASTRSLFALPLVTMIGKTVNPSLMPDEWLACTPNNLCIPAIPNRHLITAGTNVYFILTKSYLLLTACVLFNYCYKWRHHNLAINQSTKRKNQLEPNDGYSTEVIHLNDVDR